MNTFKIREVLISSLFILFFSIACHFIFSSLGFVPMDDGIFLAYSRRILDGQLPYKDFLYYANIGTPLLYLPFVHFGGEYTYLITRFFFWFEFACISWIWTYLITKNFLSHKVSNFFKISVAGIAFFFGTHSFPPMAWYTVDGLFFYSLGLWLCWNKNITYKTIGYFLIGFTFIIKQNFIFLLPITIFLLKDWKSIRLWTALLLPSILFYSFFLLTGALGDLLRQTTSRTEFIETAIKGFIAKFTFPWGIIFGFSGISLLFQAKFKAKLLGIGVLLIPIIYSFLYLHQAEKFIFDASFFLLGSVLGLAIFFIKNEKLSKNVVILLLGTTLAWCTGISGGYITPVFASGILIIYLISTISFFIHNSKSLKKRLGFFWKAIIILIVIIVIYNFYFIRTNNIYGEIHPAKELIYKADTVLPGGKNILVSKETYEVLLDLKSAIKVANDKQKPYAILSYATGIWVKSPQQNPLPMDYYFVYHGQKALVEPLKESIIKGKGNIIIIVNKNNLTEKEDYSKYNSVYRFALLVPKYYTKFAETKYHVLFE